MQVVADRTGIFISHAHEDVELATAVRAMLQAALSLDDADITCTSDPEYGLSYDGNLGPEIHHRLDSARALILLATPAAREKEWVLHECGYAAAAAADGKMKFYVLIAVPSHREVVPDPHRGNIAVTLSNGKAIHAFVRQLQVTFPGRSTLTDDAFEAALTVVERSAAIARKEAEARATTDAQRALDRQGSLERERDQLKMNLTRVKAQRLGFAAVAAMLVLIGAYEWNTRTQVTLKEKFQDELSAAIANVGAERDKQLRSRPFSGLFLDPKDQVVYCTKVTAQGAAGTDAQSRDCDHQGQFTFEAGLGVLPEEPFTLTVVVNDKSHHPPSMNRLEVPAGIYLRGAK